MPGLKLIAITPKRKPINLVAQGARQSAAMRSFGIEMHNAMAKYPPARPWTSRVPRSGPRRYGRRTGTLGRGWTVRYTRVDNAIVEVNVENRTRYATYVQGPKRGGKGERQTAVMRRRGWQNITDESAKVWRKHEGKVAASLRVSSV